MRYPLSHWGGVSLSSYRNRKRTHDNITGSGVDSSDNRQKNQKMRLFVDEIINKIQENLAMENQKSRLLLVISKRFSSD